MLAFVTLVTSLSRGPQSVNQSTAVATSRKLTRVTPRPFLGQAVLVIVVSVFGGVFALSQLATTFRTYDDEGYLLLSVEALPEPWSPLHGYIQPVRAVLLLCARIIFSAISPACDS